MYSREEIKALTDKVLNMAQGESIEPRQDCIRVEAARPKTAEFGLGDRAVWVNALRRYDITSNQQRGNSNQNNGA